MFYDCTSLTSLPALPATTLTESCYDNMFRNCTSLTGVSITLPATTLATLCYRGMFSYCSNLVSVPSNLLPVTTLAEDCYAYMFQYCTSLTTAPTLPATTLATISVDDNCCYGFMFKNCTSLTTAPELPATTLTERCYQQMFYGCSSLNKITCNATNISATDCTKDWVSGVASTGTFKKNLSMSSWTTGVNGIPSGWTVQNIPPPEPGPVPYA